MLLSVGPTCFSKNENHKPKSEYKIFWILTSSLEMRIYKMHFV
jgi:hypothetical protein